MSGAIKLTAPMKSAIKFSECNPISFNHYIQHGMDYSPRKQTIAALVSRGLLFDAAYCDRDRYYLTDEGERVRRDLVYNTCERCGEYTHSQEAACINCGELKQWAKDDLEYRLKAHSDGCVLCNEDGTCSDDCKPNGF